MEVYLALVRQTEEYFEEIMIFEKEKADGFVHARSGGENSDRAVPRLFGNGNGNYLYSTFADRVMELNTLTEKEKVTIYRKMHLQYPIMCFLRMSV